MLGFSRTLATADVGYDTIGAKIITAVGNIYPCVGVARAVRFDILDDIACRIADLYHALFLGKLAFYKRF